MTETRRKRILVITRNLPPLVGGMEQLNWHMAEELSKVADVRLVAPEGSAVLAPTGVETREAPLKPLWKFLLRTRALARHEAKAWKPDIVLAGSGLTAPIALSAARACGAKTAVYVHGLDVAARHPLYRAVWLPAIRRMDRVIANSRATSELCRAIGVQSERISIVHPGVSLPSITPEARSDAAIRFRNEQDLGNRPLLLSVGRLTERKGLREFVAHSLPHIVAVKPNVMLLIIGNAPGQALYAKAQTRESIQTAADAAGVGKHLMFLGAVTDRHLATIYESADVHVFPARTIPGDPEGFGMVAIEAAAHGLPTVAFVTGGVVDAVAEGQSGHLVAPGDYTSFADVVLKALMQREAMRASCIHFAQRFAWPAFGVQITSLLLNNKAST